MVNSKTGQSWLTHWYTFARQASIAHPIECRPAKILDKNDENDEDGNAVDALLSPMTTQLPLQEHGQVHGLRTGSLKTLSGW